MIEPGTRTWRRGSGLLPCTILILAVLSTSVFAADGVRFLAPRHLATVLGPSVIRLEVAPPAGVSVVRVEVLSDGEPLGTLTGPPWTLEWDAGDGSRGHSLHAILHLSDGTRRHAGVRTSALRINAVEEVDLVNLYAVVRDSDGRYVTDLTREDFLLDEDGRAERIERFSADRKPLTVSIVLDSSLTMDGRKIDAARDSAVRFLDALEDGDRAMVIRFNGEVRVLQELTDDRRELSESIRSVEAHGGTALYDAIWKASDRLRGIDGRKVLILLSDGRDEAANGLEPGSLHTLSEALDKALRNEVMIFAIGFGRDLDQQFDFYERTTLAEILSRLAESTGGRVLFPKRTGALRSAFEEVAVHLRHQYSIAYSPDNESKDGAWREIRLRTRQPELEVVTRKGYYAASDRADEGANAVHNGPPRSAARSGSTGGIGTLPRTPATDLD